jgi:peptide/nickel transport system ATP-binding protein
MSHLLSIRDLKIDGLCDEQWKPIVKGINISLDRGEVIGLIGESGAGKSTIGMAAMGYHRAGCKITGGSVVFDGVDMNNAPQSVIRKICGNRIAYVAQSAAASFNPAHCLMEQCVESLIQNGSMKTDEIKLKVIDLFRRLDLPDPETIGQRYPHQVSGGQLQRVMVAMAMVGDPDVIVFDEPTTALDVTTQIEVLTAIKEAIRQLNSAAIYISHDLAVVAQVADRIMVLRHGETVEMGKAREILANPKEKYTKQLLGVRTLREEKVVGDIKKEIVLEVSNMSASYKMGNNVVDDITFKICKGRTVAVVGESGSGKTTLARVITGLLPPFQGEVRFADQVVPPDLKSRDRDLLRRLQMIYQMPDLALNPRHKVRKIIGRPLDFYFKMSTAEQEKRILELLEMIELPHEYINRYPSELSGGEKQRVCIARALAAKPDLIICDEITSALDQLVAEEILKLLQNLQNELGVSYLFITHDLATVKAISDEILVMLQGKIVEKGVKSEVLAPPHHKYTDRLLSSVPEMDPDWLNNLLIRKKNAAAKIYASKSNE